MGPGLKKFQQTLSKSSKIAIDSSCFIYHIEQNKQYIELTRIIFNELLSKAHTQAVGSTLLITEILTKPYRHKRADLVLDYKNIVLNFPNFSVVAPNEDICEGAALLRAKYNFRTPDAIHIATAIEENASAIVGNDKRWKQIKEIKSIILEDFV